MKRWLHLDALRGLAALLMVTQHVNYWLNGQPHGSGIGRMIGALGGLAAPIFVTLAGLVAVLSLERHPDCDKISMIRGLLLMGLGFVLNLLTPHWFSPHSFFSMSRPCLADHPHRPCGRDPRIGGLLQILATLFPVSKPHGHNRGSSIFRPNLCALA